MAFEQYLSFLQQNKYVYSLVLIATFYVISQLAAFISQKIILKITSKTKTDIDDLIVKRTNRPISIILLLVGFRLALLPLGIKQSVLDVLKLNPETVELYALGLMPQTGLGRKDSSFLMHSKEIYECYEIGRSLFLEAGYAQDCHNRYVIYKGLRSLHLVNKKSVSFLNK